MLSNLNLIHKEINEYNKQFWSKYLISLLTFVGTLIVLLLSLLIMTPLGVTFKLLYIYALLLWTPLFLFQILTASSVNYESNKSYKVLNSLMANSIKSRTKFSIHLKIKVLTYFHCYYYLKLIIYFFIIFR